MTEEQWELNGPLLPEPKRRRYGRGRLVYRSLKYGEQYVDKGMNYYEENIAP